MLKYKKIYIPTFIVLLISLYIDGKLFTLFTESQYISNLIVLATFIWIFRNSSKQIKQLMLYGVVIGVGGEVVFSLLLGMYEYRLANIPLYVPLGHSIVYASVYYIVKEPIFKANKELIVKYLYILMLIYSALWLLFANDWFGFLSTIAIVYLFKRYPNTKAFFLVMYFMVVYLELLGTSFNCWYWPDIWFNKISFIPSANPPSGISLFYFGFDIGCLWFYKKLNPKKWSRFKRLKVSFRNSKSR